MPLGMGLVVGFLSDGSAGVDGVGQGGGAGEDLWLAGRLHLPPAVRHSESPLPFQSFLSFLQTRVASVKSSLVWFRAARLFVSACAQYI